MPRSSHDELVKLLNDQTLMLTEASDRSHPIPFYKRAHASDEYERTTLTLGNDASQHAKVSLTNRRRMGQSARR